MDMQSTGDDLNSKWRNGDIMERLGRVPYGRPASAGWEWTLVLERYRQRL